jgi:hypothetical protein
MQDIGSVLVKIGLAVGVFLLVRMGCTIQTPQEAPRTLQFAQTWELQPGDVVAERRITGGLGDISIELKGNSIYAPFDGRVQPDENSCVIFSSDEIPAYLFRLCGLKQPRLGTVRAGDNLGSGDHLEFAALRKQPSGAWSFVEPSRSMIERTLRRP